MDTKYIDDLEIGESTIILLYYQPRKRLLAAYRRVLRPFFLPFPRLKKVPLDNNPNGLFLGTPGSGNPLLQSVKL